MSNRSDNFNRADGAIGNPSDGGSAWVALSGIWQTSSNTGQEVASSAQAICCLEASAAEVTVQGTYAVAGTDSGIAGRIADNNNYIVGVSTLTTMAMYKKVAGSFTQLGSTFTGTVSNGDVMSLVFSGNSIAWKQNGTTRVSATDAAGSTNTKHGLRNNSAATPGKFDDFSITDPAAAGGQPTMRRFGRAPLGVEGVGVY